jgi:hypothetical protein
MTDDALKAAVREALNEIPHCEDILNDLTSALARRGVVVVAEEQNDALMYLRAARDAYFEGNAHDGSEQSPEGCLYAAIERVLSLGALVRNAASESPAPKPARKVVQTAMQVDRSIGIVHHSALCDDGTHWFFQSGEWVSFPPIPQPGDEQ